MLNLFPTMFLSLVAYAVLRIMFGLTLLFLGYQHATGKRIALETALAQRFGKMAGFLALYLALAEILLGLMFIAGFYTQAAALAAIAYSLKMLFFRKSLAYPIVPSSMFYILALGISVSLLITGAGIFAFDIPI